MRKFAARGFVFLDLDCRECKRIAAEARLRYSGDASAGEEEARWSGATFPCPYDDRLADLDRTLALNLTRLVICSDPAGDGAYRYAWYSTSERSHGLHLYADASVAARLERILSVATFDVLAVDVNTTVVRPEVREYNDLYSRVGVIGIAGDVDSTINAHLREAGPSVSRRDGRLRRPADLRDGARAVRAVRSNGGTSRPLGRVRSNVSWARGRRDVSPIEVRVR